MQISQSFSAAVKMCRGTLPYDIKAIKDKTKILDNVLLTKGLKNLSIKQAIVHTYKRNFFFAEKSYHLQ